MKISDYGACFQSLSEPWADTTTHADKMIMTLFGGITEFEREIMRERTAAGRETARRRGVRCVGLASLIRSRSDLPRGSSVKESQSVKLPKRSMSTLRRFTGCQHYSLKCVHCSVAPQHRNTCCAQSAAQTARRR
jgi:DNA invertase Pin-like site-specific DNA recombinase